MPKKNHLTEADRKKLEKERALTRAELEHLREYLRSAPEATGDEVDLAVYEREKKSCARPTARTKNRRD